MKHLIVIALFVLPLINMSCTKPQSGKDVLKGYCGDDSARVINSRLCRTLLYLDERITTLEKK